ncbi:undecaprenyl-diphosphatase UppP [Candidatus Peregrinibacteria bacterium]|jgi:undecaprenyl-diphosphatase|nr:undecaprenyl-diphosphatase UppP [Candidatus Peregrinibacteria bacterium]
MEWFEALILGVLQGITEFLPISSSGHLVLGEHFLGLEMESLKTFDVLVHVGTLLAIIVYFWKDFIGLLKAFFGLFLGKFDGEYVKLIGFIVIGTIPAVFLGLFGGDAIDSVFRDVKMVGLMMLLVGVVFILGEYVNKRVKKSELTWWKAIIIGLAQALALIPGVSRSGSTIVMGLFNGIEREKAARFSFLLGMPAIAGAGLLTTLDLFKGGGGISGDASISWIVLLVGFVSAFLAGLLSVSFLMKFLKKHTLLVFAVYLIILGVSIFI